MTNDIETNDIETNATPDTKKRATRKTKKPVAKKPVAKKTMTSVDIANEYKIDAKTLRARIRRNIDKWECLFVDGQRHVFADNVTTRKTIATLIAK